MISHTVASTETSRMTKKILDATKRNCELVVKERLKLATPWRHEVDHLMTDGTHTGINAARGTFLGVPLSTPHEESDEALNALSLDALPGTDMLVAGFNQ